MKLIIWMFVSLVFARSSFSQAKQKLSILTYNIRHAGPPSKPATIDVDAIAAVIKKNNPDLVALQEVDVNTRRSGVQLNQARALGDKLGMQYYFAKAIDFDGGEYGVAILSKYPFDSVSTYKLPSATSTAEPRILALAYLRVKKTPLVFACTHLDAEKDDQSRLMQMKTIDSVLKTKSHTAILAGDLNSEPGSKVIDLLNTQYLTSCVKQCAFSFPADKPSKTIDFIAHRKSDPCRFIQHEVLDEPFPSDHRPVLAILELLRR